jgi:hypothetical protein
MEINFEHKTAAHCENGVTANLLRYYGYDYSEPLIFGLSASLFFVHLPFIKLAGFPVTSFRPLPGAIFARVTNLLGFKIHKKIFLSRKHAARKLEELVTQGIPTGCVTGMYYLPYMPLAYRFHFNAHNICVIGKDGDKWLLSDPCATEKVQISSKDLLRARFAKGTWPPFGKLYWIAKTPDKQPDLNLLVRKSILKNCWRMLHMPGPMPFIGVNAFKHLGDKLPQFPKIYGARRAALHLAQLIRMMEEIGTGGACFRFLYAAFLQEAAQITGIDELNDFSQRLTEIGDQWRVFAADAGRISKNRSAEGVDYQHIGAQLIAIGEMERDFFTRLENIEALKSVK